MCRQTILTLCTRTDYLPRRLFPGLPAVRTLCQHSNANVRSNPVSSGCTDMQLVLPHVRKEPPAAILRPGVPTGTTLAPEQRNLHVSPVSIFTQYGTPNASRVSGTVTPSRPWSRSRSTPPTRVCARCVPGTHAHVRLRPLPARAVAPPAAPAGTAPPPPVRCPAAHRTTGTRTAPLPYSAQWWPRRCGVHWDGRHDLEHVGPVLEA